MGARACGCRFFSGVPVDEGPERIVSLTLNFS